MRELLRIFSGDQVKDQFDEFASCGLYLENDETAEVKNSGWKIFGTRLCIDAVGSLCDAYTRCDVEKISFSGTRDEFFIANYGGEDCAFLERATYCIRL